MQPLDRSPFSLTDTCTGLLPTCDSVLARRFSREYISAIETKMPPRKRKTAPKSAESSEKVPDEKKAKSDAPVPRVVIEHW